MKLELLLSWMNKNFYTDSEKILLIQVVLIDFYISMKQKGNTTEKGTQLFPSCTTVLVFQTRAVKRHLGINSKSFTIVRQLYAAISCVDTQVCILNSPQVCT